MKRIAHGDTIIGLRDVLYADDIMGTPDSKVHGANMGPTWVLSAPDGLHVGPMNLVIRDTYTRIAGLNAHVTSL